MSGHHNPFSLQGLGAIGRRRTDRRLLRLRRAHLLRTCKRLTFTGTLYHGSPLYGMEEIFNDGHFCAPEHGELSMPLFSTSLNSEMLRYFGEEGVHGFQFAVDGMEVLELSAFYQSLLCAHESNTEMWHELVELHPQAEAEARFLGYEEAERQRWGTCGAESVFSMSPHDMDELLPVGVEGFALLGWNNVTQHNHEAEIAVNENGCARLWRSVERVWVDGDEYEREEGEQVLRQHVQWQRETRKLREQERAERDAVCS
jgi:hypothetical protein